MGIKFNDESKAYEVSYAKRHPLTRQPKSLSRTRNNEGELIHTKAEAMRIYNDLVLQLEKSFEIPEEGKLLYRDLLDRFYQDLEDRDLAKATVENYRLCLDAHTRNLWGHRELESIQPKEVKSLIKEALSHRSKSHQKSMLKFLRGVFNFAVEERLIARSPIPKMQFREGDKFKNVLTEVQAGILLEKAKSFDHEWYPHWAMALYTGMRNEELYALTWHNVNFDSRLIYVREVWTKKDGFKKVTKSGHDRAVEIAPPLIPMLKELKIANPDSPFVLPRLDGWDGTRQAEFLGIFLAGIGLPKITFHNLRATWATILLSKGVEPIKVMKLGGWASLKTLNDHYVRLSGVDIKGTTDVLSLHNPSNQPAQVLKMPNCIEP